ncbi:MAG: T9SS type A sorting domain-containing protein [Bacteroidales bacterium]|jgi:hypothetical protein|nr:T9SS type A sorting domain-containing protein [Bacteroidales bacterium]
MKKLFFLLFLLCLAGITVHAQQRKVLVEEFTSSTCGPCYSVNLWLNPLLVTNADKVVAVKYQMNWPAPGDPYCTPEGLTRRTYYGVNSVPTIFTNGVTTSNSQTSVQNAINNGYAQPAEADIEGVFQVVGNMIYVETNVTPLISGSNYLIHCIVNEKTTTGNKKTNGETHFYHVMMKMFPDGNGTTLNLTAGETISFMFSHDMSTTHVEEMSDLEVVVFVQNKSTRAVLNAAYLPAGNVTSPLPPSNFTATQQGETLNINLAWSAVSGASGYNVYRNGVKLNTAPVTGTTYSDVAPEYGITYTYGVAAVVGSVEGFEANATVFTNITIPTPTITTVKQIRGKQMLVEWEMPPGFEVSVKYFVYRSGIKQTTDPITETSIINTGLSYKEYCFEIEPILNEITGAKSTSVCINLLDIPQPKNLKAEQVSVTSKEVLLTWDASTSNTAGYNLYRDDVLINTELITSTTYTDVVPEFGVQYTYQLYGVASTGAESEKYAEAKITLSNSAIPPPANVQAIQQGNELIVSVTWASPLSGLDGYNIYRDGEKINTELVTETEYLDEVPAEDKYCYTVTAVMGDDEGEKSDPPACADVNIVGIGNIDKDTFMIYPNPVSGTLNISTTETITDCQIFNIQGQLIYSTQLDVKEIVTDNWTSGIYVIRITTEKGVAEKRFIKN